MIDNKYKYLYNVIIRDLSQYIARQTAMFTKASEI